MLVRDGIEPRARPCHGLGFVAVHYILLCDRPYGKK